MTLRPPCRRARPGAGPRDLAPRRRLGRGRPRDAIPTDGPVTPRPRSMSRTRSEAEPHGAPSTQVDRPRPTDRPLEERPDPRDRAGRRDRLGQERGRRPPGALGAFVIDADKVGHALLGQQPGARARRRAVRARRCSTRRRPRGRAARRSTAGPWARSSSPTRRRGRRWSRSSTRGCGTRSRRRSPGSSAGARRRPSCSTPRSCTRRAGTRSATSCCSSTPPARSGSPGSTRERGWDEAALAGAREGPVGAGREARPGRRGGLERRRASRPGAGGRPGLGRAAGDRPPPGAAPAPRGRRGRAAPRHPARRRPSRAASGPRERGPTAAPAVHESHALLLFVKTAETDLPQHPPRPDGPPTGGAPGRPGRRPREAPLQARSWLDGMPRLRCTD